jgi:DNA ligase (NAD+)
MNIEEKEELYLRAKAEYYKGSEIMSDLEFDTLEEELKAEGSPVVFVVDGDDTVGTRFPHMNPMLSLEKVQVLDENVFPVEDLDKWFNKQPNKTLSVECTPKFDGSAMSLKYVNGKLTQALTRGGGDNRGGLDKTDKLNRMVPNTITIGGVVEIRGEIVIDKEIFAKKYAADYRNERNFVAGIMNKDEDWEDFIDDFQFVAYHLVRDADTESVHEDNTMEMLTLCGFNKWHTPFVIHATSAAHFFSEIYDTFKHYRSDISPYRLDGIVLKMNSVVRKQMGENSHHPKWALAIKFPPEEQITTIKNIIWQLGPSGAMTPIADLEPINLDGTTVKHASLHNLGKIIENRCWPGAHVIIAKRGDIIPQVIKVIKGATTESEIPCSCPVCNIKLEISESKIARQLYCPNEDCAGKGLMKLAQGIKILGIERIGPAAAEDLYNAGIKSVVDLFNPDKFNKGELIESGLFKRGRALDIILDGVYDLKEVNLADVINSLKFTDSGSSISKEVAKYMSQVPYDFKGLNKSVVEKLITVDTLENNRLHELINTLHKAGIKVNFEIEEAITEGIQYFEMTGSPKPFFSTKEEFTQFAFNKNFKNSKLTSDCKYLLTDSYSSSSSKMGKAKKLGVEIISYEDFQNKLK